MRGIAGMPVVTGLSIPCSCRCFACVGASCIFPTLHQALETAGVTPAQQVPRVM